ncbi:MAG: L-rhamnose mutarotase [Pseudomonadota bacterium]
MKLYPGVQAEYKKRHDEIWPELEALLRQSGIFDYWIFLDEASNTLFGHYKLKDNHTVDQLPTHPLMKKWWDYMAPLMETEPSNKPVQIDLKPVFSMV